MKIKLVLLSFVLVVVSSLSACNTTNGLSQDVNHASDSIHRAINS